MVSIYCGFLGTGSGITSPGFSLRARASSASESSHTILDLGKDENEEGHNS